MELTARESELADVALGVLAKEGIAAVTFRSVAAASGWSLGAVQKAFATKDDLLAAMFTRLRASAGLAPSLPPGEPDVAAWLTALLLGILPTDETRRALTLQGAAFGERAAYDAHLAAALAESDAGLRELIASLVKLGQSRGEVPAAVSPEAAAWAFLALAQGAATQLLYDPVKADVLATRARAAVDAILAVAH